jgi:hypothetical protein
MRPSPVGGGRGSRHEFDKIRELEMKAADEWKRQRSSEDRVNSSSEIKALTTLPVTILVVSQLRFRNPQRALRQPRVVATRVVATPRCEYALLFGFCVGMVTCLNAL